MKSNKLTLLPLAIAMHTFSPAALAQQPELDMTMTIMEEGQEPAGFIQKIPLPAPGETVARDDVSAESADRIADQVREESGQLTDEASGTVTDDIKDALSIEGVTGPEELPRDIVDNLTEDLPLLDDPVEDLPDLPDLPGEPNLPDLPGLPGVPELPVLPQAELPQDVSQEAADVIDAIDNTVEETVEEGAGDAASEIERTLEETKKLLP